MNIFSSTFLGIVQGLTEFLPVSSSGHLVFFQKLIPGFTQPGVLFDAVLHFGTLLSVIYFFRKKLFTITPKYIYLLIVGTIPAVFAGLFFKNQLENMFSDARFLGVEFLVTALMNFATDIPQKKKEKLNTENSFLIGVSQAIAIIPAISRSGATIFTGVRLGIDRKKVAEYSFLLSIPAIFAANLLEVVSFRNSLPNGLISYYLAGFFSSFVIGFYSIGLVMKFLEKRNFKIFGYYCLLVGIISLILLK